MGGRAARQGEREDIATSLTRSMNEALARLRGEPVQPPGAAHARSRGTRYRTPNPRAMKAATNTMSTTTAISTWLTR